MVKGLTHILVNDSAVAALVGDNKVGSTVKIYPIISTQLEAFPMITVWETSRVPEYCRGQRPTTFNYTYEVHIYSKDYDANNAIAIAIQTALEEADVNSAINGVMFTDMIRNTNRRDLGYIEEYKAYGKVLTFEAPVNEDQAT